MAKQTPIMANHFVKAMRGFMAYCVAAGLRPDDPMSGIKNPRVKTAGYYTWTEDNIAAFRACHPIGTRARLALEIALNTAQRRGDIIRLGRQHIRNGVIHINQRKTGQAVEIPVHADLAAVIDPRRKTISRFSRPRKAGRFPSRISPTGFWQCAKRPDCRPAVRCTACARRLAAGWRRPAAPSPRSWPSAATGRWRKCRGISRPVTGAAPPARPWPRSPQKRNGIETVKPGQPV